MKPLLEHISIPPLSAPSSQWSLTNWYDDIHLAAQSDANVLLISDDARRNERAARLIHGREPYRASGTFRRIDCREVIADLPNAVADAEPVTLFFDHVDALDRAAQLALFQWLDTLARPADDRERASVRIIAASTCDLFDEVRGHRFRADLYYRLNVVTIRVPPISVARMTSGS